MARRRASLLTERVIVQQDVETDDGKGGQSHTSNTLDTVWADVMPLSSDERLRAAALESNISYRVRLRQWSSILASMRLLWTPSWDDTIPQKTLEIGAIVPDGREYMIAECSEAL